MIKYLLILLLITGSVNAQQLPGSFLSPNPGARGVTYNGLKALREFYLPQYDTTFTPSWEGAIVYRMDDQTPYIYRGAKWQVVGGFYSDSAARVAVGGSYRVKWFGALGDGSTNDIAAINNAVSSIPVGSTLEFTPNAVYNVASKVILNKQITIIGNGARINLTANNATAIAIQSSNVTIDNLKVNGTGYASYNVGGELVRTEGSTESNYYDNVKVTNCEIYNSTNGGLKLSFVTNFRIDKNKLYNFPYYGVMVLSAKNGLIDLNSVDNITMSGSLPDCYGIAVSQQNVTSSAHISSNVIVSRNTVSNLPTWEALDTHGGQFIQFINNRVINALTGIAIVSYPLTMGVSSAPNGNVISGNTIDNEAVVGDGANRQGIRLAGLDSNTVAKGIIIDKNILTGSGVYISNTNDIQVTNNIATRPQAYGVLATEHNDNITITGNHFTDIFSLVSGNTAGVKIGGSSYIKGSIYGNTSIRTSFVNPNGALVNFVNYYGVLSFSTGLNSLSLGKNDWSSAYSRQYVSTGAPAQYEGFGVPSFAAEISSTYRQKDAVAGRTIWQRGPSSWEIVTTSATVSPTVTAERLYATVSVTGNPGIQVTGDRSYIRFNSTNLAAGGFATPMVQSYATNVGGDSTKVSEIGVYGDGRTSPIAPTVRYMYFGANKATAFDNAAIKLDSSGRVGIGLADISIPFTSAILQLNSTDKGVLLPRMTSAEINAIASPAFGLMAVNRTRQTIRMYDTAQGKWRRILSGDTTILTSGMQPIANATGDFAMAVPTGTSGVIVTPSSGGLNYKADTALMATNAQLQKRIDSLSATLIKTGQAFISGDGTSSFYDITLPTTPTWIGAPNPANAGSINISYALPITNGIRIYWSTPPLSGTNNIAVFYSYK